MIYVNWPEILCLFEAPLEQLNLTGAFSALRIVYARAVSQP
jgi:hypothetical protein